MSGCGDVKEDCEKVGKRGVTVTERRRKWERKKGPYREGTCGCERSKEKLLKFARAIAPIRLFVPSLRSDFSCLHCNG